jgi:diacylglycerol kinase family enzyme
MRPTAALVVNRNRIRRLAQLTRRCAAAAAARGWDIEVAETRSADAGDGATRQAVAAGARLVFAVGGDGTVRACAQALAGRPVPLAIVPRGTANLVATALSIPSSLGAALAVGFGQHERRIDLAEADGTTFAAMAGIGLDAAVVAATAAGLKGAAGWLGYAATGVRRLAGAPNRFEIRLDGGEPMSRQARCVVVGNFGLLPGGFIMLPAARPDDGLLDVGILAPAGPFGWLRVGWRVVSRSHHDDAVLERYQARRVEIAADATLPREADGELIGAASSLTVALAAGGLLVRVPAARSLAEWITSRVRALRSAGAAGRGRRHAAGASGVKPAIHHTQAWWNPGSITRGCTGAAHREARCAFWQHRHHR